eukprot:GHVS01088095.1.p1 GENE.GHVS01088095.1~~GHVS01088095.1.p1  ORF type:complete len:366 (-),score=48.14 GHVS01088095.1:564-1661(-)
MCTIIVIAKLCVFIMQWRRIISVCMVQRDMLKDRPNMLDDDEHPNDLSKVEGLLGMKDKKTTKEKRKKEKEKSEENSCQRYQYKRNEEGVPDEKLAHIVRNISSEGKPPVQLFKPPTPEQLRTLTKQGRKRRGMNEDKYRWLLSIGAGKRKGKKLRSPGVYLRPMMAKVKSSVFAMLSRFGMFDAGANIRVLDLYSGSGSVAIEALSRGASQATLVDNSQECCDTAGYNLEMCHFDGRVIRATVEEVLKFPAMFSLYEPFELVFVCPPYQEVVYSELIQDIADSPVVGDETIVVVEYPKEIGPLPARVGNSKLYGIRNRKYGRTVLAVYIKQSTKRPVIGSLFKSGEISDKWREMEYKPEEFEKL